MNESQLTALHQATGTTNSEGNLRVVDLITHSGLCSSNGESKKAIKSGAISLNENRLDDIGYEITETDTIN